jgi:hypothetical protein
MNRLGARHGRIAGDRVLGVRFANASALGDAWGRKHEFVALVNTPGLARLHVMFDHKALRVRISLQGKVLADEGLEDTGRERIATAIQEYVLNLQENLLYTPIAFLYESLETDEHLLPG